MSDDSRERRRHPRVPLTLPIRVSTIDPEVDPFTGRSFFRASRELCGNLSRGGAFIRTSEPLVPGRRVLIELELPGGRAVEAVGRVAWSRVALAPAAGASETGVGVEFLGAAAAELAALEDLLCRAEPAPEGAEAPRARA